MALNVPRLRKWFAVAAIAVVVVVAGFYFYARWRVAQEVAQLPERLGIEIQQSTEGFTLSRSEGGRTLFTIKASRAVQFRAGGRFELKDVDITVFGRRAERFDRIYGADFLYDPNTGDVSARGVVHIDLEAKAEHSHADASREGRTPIHLKTSGLTFNHKTGLAETKEEIEFRFPQAGGTAQGATYDSRTSVLTLQSDVRAETRDDTPATLLARRAVLTGAERRIELEGTRLQRDQGSFAAGRMTVLLREDNTIARMLAQDGVRAQQGGASAGVVEAPRAEFQMGERNQLRSVTLAGGVDFRSAGRQPLDGRAQSMLLQFAAGNRLQSARAHDAVRLSQRQPGQAQAVDMQADALDFYFREGQVLQRAVTSGQAHVVLTGGDLPLGAHPAAATQGQAGRTVVTAGRFEADFQQGRLHRLQGAPQARIVSTTAGRPDRVATSEQITVDFAPGGAVGQIVQEGDFRYREGERSAFAQMARYDAVRDELLLSGSPRVLEGGTTATALSIRLVRRTGIAVAEGDVKTTYTGLAPQAGGALLAAGDPIHVTAPRVTLHSAAGQARYSGGARLWQGANIVQAPTLEFDRERRSVLAQGTPGQPVTTVFVQPDARGQPAPISVTAARLSYADQLRRARFEGGVVARSTDATMTAGQIDVFLQSREQEKPAEAAGTGTPSQVQRIVAEGGIVIQQPTRRATGERLVYTAEEGKFVLTGGSPSIFDAEHGKIEGDSLTFFSRDDRVLVGSGHSAPAVTQTRVRD